MANSSFSYQISKYFSEYLPLHIGASKNTIEAYRDAFVQLLEYKKKCSNIRPDHFDFDSITREDVENFLIDMNKKKVSALPQGTSVWRPFIPSMPFYNEKSPLALTTVAKYWLYHSRKLQ